MSDNSETSNTIELLTDTLRRSRIKRNINERADAVDVVSTGEKDELASVSTNTSTSTTSTQRRQRRLNEIVGTLKSKSDQIRRKLKERERYDYERDREREGRELYYHHDNKRVADLYDSNDSEEEASTYSFSNVIEEKHGDDDDVQVKGEDCDDTVTLNSNENDDNVAGDDDQKDNLMINRSNRINNNDDDESDIGWNVYYPEKKSQQHDGNQKEVSLGYYLEQHNIKSNTTNTNVKADTSQKQHQQHEKVLVKQKQKQPSQDKLSALGVRIRKSRAINHPFNYHHNITNHPPNNTNEHSPEFSIHTKSTHSSSSHHHGGAAIAKLERAKVYNNHININMNQNNTDNTSLMRNTNSGWYETMASVKIPNHTWDPHLGWVRTPKGQDDDETTTSSSNSSSSVSNNTMKKKLEALPSSSYTTHLHHRDRISSVIAKAVTNANDIARKAAVITKRTTNLVEEDPPDILDIHQDDESQDDEDEVEYEKADAILLTPLKQKHKKVESERASSSSKSSSPSNTSKPSPSSSQSLAGNRVTELSTTIRDREGVDEGEKAESDFSRNNKLSILENLVTMLQSQNKILLDECNSLKEEKNSNKSEDLTVNNKAEGDVKNSDNKNDLKEISSSEEKEEGEELNVSPATYIRLNSNNSNSIANSPIRSGTSSPSTLTMSPQKSENSFRLNIVKKRQLAESFLSSSPSPTQQIQQPERISTNKKSGSSNNTSSGNRSDAVTSPTSAASSSGGTIAYNSLRSSSSAALSFDEDRDYDGNDGNIDDACFIQDPPKIIKKKEMITSNDSATCDELELRIAEVILAQTRNSKEKEQLNDEKKKKKQHAIAMEQTFKQIHQHTSTEEVLMISSDEGKNKPQYVQKTGLKLSLNSPTSKKRKKKSKMLHNKITTNKIPAIATKIKDKFILVSGSSSNNNNNNNSKGGSNKTVTSSSSESSLPTNPPNTSTTKSILHKNNSSFHHHHNSGEDDSSTLPPTSATTQTPYVVSRKKKVHFDAPAIIHSIKKSEKHQRHILRINNSTSREEVLDMNDEVEVDYNDNILSSSDDDCDVDRIKNKNYPQQETQETSRKKQQRQRKMNNEDSDEELISFFENEFEQVKKEVYDKQNQTTKKSQKNTEKKVKGSTSSNKQIILATKKKKRDNISYHAIGNNMVYKDDSNNSDSEYDDNVDNDENPELQDIQKERKQLKLLMKNLKHREREQQQKLSSTSTSIVQDKGETPAAEKDNISEIFNFSSYSMSDSDHDERKKKSSLAQHQKQQKEHRITSSSSTGTGLTIKQLFPSSPSSLESSPIRKTVTNNNNGDGLKAGAADSKQKGIQFTPAYPPNKNVMVNATSSSSDIPFFPELQHHKQHQNNSDVIENHYEDEKKNQSNDSNNTMMILDRNEYMANIQRMKQNVHALDNKQQKQKQRKNYHYNRYDDSIHPPPPPPPPHHVFSDDDDDDDDTPSPIQNESSNCYSSIQQQYKKHFKLDFESPIYSNTAFFSSPKHSRHNKRTGRKDHNNQHTRHFDDLTSDYWDSYDADSPTRSIQQRSSGIVCGVCAPSNYTTSNSRVTQQHQHEDINFLKRLRNYTLSSKTYYYDDDSYYEYDDYNLYENSRSIPPDTKQKTNLDKTNVTSHPNNKTTNTATTPVHQNQSNHDINTETTTTNTDNHHIPQLFSKTKPKAQSPQQQHRGHPQHDEQNKPFKGVETLSEKNNAAPLDSLVGERFSPSEAKSTPPSKPVTNYDDKNNSSVLYTIQETASSCNKSSSSNSSSTNRSKDRNITSNIIEDDETNRSNNNNCSDNPAVMTTTTTTTTTLKSKNESPRSTIDIVESPSARQITSSKTHNTTTTLRIDSHTQKQMEELMEKLNALRNDRNSSSSSSVKTDSKQNENVKNKANSHHDSFKPASVIENYHLRISPASTSTSVNEFMSKYEEAIQHSLSKEEKDEGEERTTTNNYDSNIDDECKGDDDYDDRTVSTLSASISRNHSAAAFTTMTTAANISNIPSQLEDRSSSKDKSKKSNSVSSHSSNNNNNSRSKSDSQPSFSFLTRTPETGAHIQNNDNGSSTSSSSQKLSWEERKQKINSVLQKISMTSSKTVSSNNANNSIMSSVLLNPYSPQNNKKGTTSALR